MSKNTIVFALTSNTKLVDEVCKYLGLVPGKVVVNHFADGETLVEPQESVRGKDVFIIQSTYNPVNEKLMEVLIAIDAFKRASAASINCIIPYYGYARQDRKASARQPITAKLVANLLTIAGANRAVVVDLHASQIQGFFDFPIDNLTSIPMMGKYFYDQKLDLSNFVVVSPDHGGTTRARQLADILQTPLAIVDKRRPKPNVCEATSVVGNVADKNVIVVDDICDTGGSLVAACQILRDNGAKDIYCCITHPVLSGKAVDTIENSVIKEFITTDTIPLTDEERARTTKIKQLSIDKLIAAWIDAIIHDKPVSDVYKMYSI